MDVAPLPTDPAPRAPMPSSVPASSVPASSVGERLRAERELRGVTLEEVSRGTRIPLPSLERLETGRFDDLPGEVFVRGFLRSYARFLGLDADEVLARYGAARRIPEVAPVPIAPIAPRREGRQVGVAIALVVLVVLCTMALSFALKPRGRDLPVEVSRLAAPSSITVG